jgi:hypothetical protein
MQLNVFLVGTNDLYSWTMKLVWQQISFSNLPYTHGQWNKTQTTTTTLTFNVTHLAELDRTAVTKQMQAWNFLCFYSLCHLMGVHLWSHTIVMLVHRTWMPAKFWPTGSGRTSRSSHWLRSSTARTYTINSFLHLSCIEWGVEYYSKI